MTVVHYVTCYVHKAFPEGDRAVALREMELGLMREFAEFKRHLAEQGFDLNFKITKGGGS